MLQQINAYAMTATSTLTVIIISILLAILASPLLQLRKYVTAKSTAGGIMYTAKITGSGMPVLSDISAGKRDSMPRIKSALRSISIRLASALSKSVMTTPALIDCTLIRLAQVFRYASAYLAMVYAFFNTLDQMIG